MTILCKKLLACFYFFDIPETRDGEIFFMMSLMEWDINGPRDSELDFNDVFIHARERITFLAKFQENANPALNFTK